MSTTKKTKLSELVPNPNNPRYITEENLQKLKKSIKDFEKMLEIRPIIIDEDNVILGGNMRYQGLLALGYKDIPSKWIKKVKGLSEDEKREFIIKDNVGFGSWDWETLANEWDTDLLEDWALM